MFSIVNIRSEVSLIHYEKIIAINAPPLGHWSTVIGDQEMNNVLFIFICRVGFGAGFLGTLLSPIHACLVLGCEYFKGSLFRCILTMAPPTLIILGASVGLWALYRVWLPF